MIYKGNHPGQASVMFLPMIDMNPSDLTCINSTLHFISEHARRYSVTPMITFDQPLWWKAMTFVERKPENSPLHSVVVQLGGFHTLLSFLGCIGHIMIGTGLRELTEVMFAGNAVCHILSGRAVSRAIRGHLLIDAVLNTLHPSSEDNETGEEDIATRDELHYINQRLIITGSQTNDLANALK